MTFIRPFVVHRFYPNTYDVEKGYTADSYNIMMYNKMEQTDRSTRYIYTSCEEIEAREMLRLEFDAYMRCEKEYGSWLEESHNRVLRRQGILPPGDIQYAEAIGNLYSATVNAWNYCQKHKVRFPEFDDPKFPFPVDQMFENGVEKYPLHNYLMKLKERYDDGTLARWCKRYIEKEILVNKMDTFKEQITHGYKVMGLVYGSVWGVLMLLSLVRGVDIVTATNESGTRFEAVVVLTILSLAYAVIWHIIHWNRLADVRRELRYYNDIELWR